MFFWMTPLLQEVLHLVEGGARWFKGQESVAGVLCGDWGKFEGGALW